MHFFCQKYKTMTATVENENGVLTFEQIKAIVGDGWGIIRNPVHDEANRCSGELIFHSADEDEAYEELGRCRERREKHIAFRYFGKRDPNIVYLL